MMTTMRPATVRRRFSPRPWFVPLWLFLCAVAVPRTLTAQAIESARSGESPLIAAERVRTTLLQLAVSAAGSFGDEGPQILTLVESLADKSLVDGMPAVSATTNDNRLYSFTLPSLSQGPHTITLAAGETYTIRLDYYDNAFDAAMQLSWSSDSTAKQIIPQSQLYEAD